MIYLHFQYVDVFVHKYPKKIDILHTYPVLLGAEIRTSTYSKLLTVRKLHYHAKMLVIDTRNRKNKYFFSYFFKYKSSNSSIRQCYCLHVCLSISYEHYFRFTNSLENKYKYEYFGKLYQKLNKCYLSNLRNYL